MEKPLRGKDEHDIRLEGMTGLKTGNPGSD